MNLSNIEKPNSCRIVNTVRSRYKSWLFIALYGGYFYLFRES